MNNSNFNIVLATGQPRIPTTKVSASKNAMASILLSASFVIHLETWLTLFAINKLRLDLRNFCTCPEVLGNNTYEGGRFLNRSSLLLNNLTLWWKSRYTWGMISIWPFHQLPLPELLYTVQQPSNTYYIWTTLPKVFSFEGEHIVKFENSSAEPLFTIFFLLRLSMGVWSRWINGPFPLPMQPAYSHQYSQINSHKLPESSYPRREQQEQIRFIEGPWKYSWPLFGPVKICIQYCKWIQR